MAVSEKTLVLGTVGALVLVVAYSVVMGTSGWLWFAGIVLRRVTVGVFAGQRS